MFKNLKIATKLLLFGISVMTIPLLTVGISSISIAGNALTRSTDEQLLTRANELALLIDNVLADEIKTAKSWSILDVTVNALDSSTIMETDDVNNRISALNNTFTNIQNTEGLGENYQVIIATDTSGIIIAASQENYLGVSVSDRGYIKDALQGKVNLGAVGLNKVTGDPFIPIGIPVYSSDGRITGALATIIDILFINKISNDITIGETGYPYIIDSTGLILAHPNHDHIMKTNLSKTVGMEQVIANMVSGKRAVDKYVFEGIPKSCGYAPVELTGWSVGLTLPDEEFLAPIFLVRNIVASVGLTFLILGIAISLLFARSISSRLKKSVNFASKIASGDLTADIDINQKDEVGQLAASLQDMSQNLNNILKDINSASNQVASGAQQISSTSQEISSGATEQASSTEEVSSAMEQLAANIHQNTESSQSADEIAKKITTEATQGGEAVNQTVSAMKSIAERISVIEDIARNTNMLALNAAIEAARAGDAGKGFAVVASEVRKLAENSGNAAAEITEIAGSSVQAAEKAGNLINELVPQIQKTAELVQEINISSLEQTKGAEQINQALQQLDTVIQQNASSSEEMASMAEELSSQSELMQSNVEYFKLKESEMFARVPEEKAKSAEKKKKIARKTENTGKEKKTETADNFVKTENDEKKETQREYTADLSDDLSDLDGFSEF